jgi:beta-glucosidase-like glycosyl hydrolase
VQVGHHVVFSYPGLNPPTHLFDLIKQGKVGGIILFGENVADNLSTVISNFQDTYKQSAAYVGSPLLIMTDQEGGIVRRLPGGPVQSAKQVGQSSNPRKAATQSGKDAASALQEYQVNTNLAPVLGVYREAGDFLDNFGRSYGNTSALVATCGPAFITSQHEAGIIATAKHFPGLGAAGKTENTDEEPVTISLTLDELRSVDEIPYTKAIPAGVDMVMNSWALYPALDAKYPSGLSKAWIQDELRGRSRPALFKPLAMMRRVVSWPVRLVWILFLRLLGMSRKERPSLMRWCRLCRVDHYRRVLSQRPLIAF